MKKSQIKALDRLWSDYVKKRARYQCEYCLEPGRQLVGFCGVWLEAAHIIGRTYRATRWRLENGMCLCSACHRSYDEHRPDEAKIRRIVVGEEKYERLRTQREVIAKNQDYEELKRQLTEDYERAVANDKSNDPSNR